MRALIFDLIGYGLRLADDAEARCGNKGDAPIALVLVARDQRVNRGGEAERARVRGHVVDAAVGDHDGAGNAIGRHVGESRTERGEQARAVSLAIRLAGLHDAHVEPRNAA